MNRLKLTPFFVTDVQHQSKLINEWFLQLEKLVFFCWAKLALLTERKMRKIFGFLLFCFVWSANAEQKTPLAARSFGSSNMPFLMPADPRQSVYGQQQSLFNYMSPATTTTSRPLPVFYSYGTAAPATSAPQATYNSYAQPPIMYGYGTASTTAAPLSYNAYVQPVAAASPVYAAAPVTYANPTTTTTTTTAGGCNATNMLIGATCQSRQRHVYER